MAPTYFLLALATLTFVSSAFGQLHRSQFTSPQQTSSNDFCQRKGQKSYICDPDKKLTFTEANQLDRTIERILNETRCPCSEYVCKRDRRGYHIGVAVAPKMLSDEEMKDYTEGADEYEREYSPRTRLHNTELFAYTLLKNWKFGKCEDDLMIVYDPVNFSLYTVGGKTALRKLTPSLIGGITMNNREDFAKGTYEGLQRVLADYRLVLLNKYEADPVYSSRPKTAAVVGGNGASNVTPITALSLISLVFYALW